MPWNTPCVSLHTGPPRMLLRLHKATEQAHPAGRGHKKPREPPLFLYKHTEAKSPSKGVRSHHNSRPCLDLELSASRTGRKYMSTPPNPGQRQVTTATQYRVCQTPGMLSTVPHNLIHSRCPVNAIEKCQILRNRDSAARLLGAEILAPPPSWVIYWASIFQSVKWK